jgi:hypothetical protein
MQSENTLETGVSTAPEPKPSKSNRLIWVHVLTFLLGFAILGFVIYRIGLPDLMAMISQVGWGFLVIIALNISRHLLRATSLYRAVHPEHRNFKYRNAVVARFGGEAMTAVSFAGPFLADATKAVLLKKDTTLTQSTSAVIIDNFLYYMTVILVVLGGVGALLLLFGNRGTAVNRALLVIVIVAVLAFTGLILALVFRVKPFTRVIMFLEGRNIAPHFILKRKESLHAIEKNVFHFYHDRRKDFFIVFGISMSVHIISVAEVFSALTFLGYRPFVSTAFIIESLTKVINATFSFIPGAIGAYEGGNGIILATLGYTTAVGVALGLVRRGAIIVSTLIGVAILIWRTAERSSKQLAK